MALTTAGRDVFAAAIIGDSYTAFNAANTRLGVGTSSTAFAQAQTDMQAAGVRAGMDATYPQRSTNVITFRATFTEAQANQAWNEWGVFNAASGPTMLSRKVESLGTKPSSEAWRLTATITVVAS